MSRLKLLHRAAAASVGLKHPMEFRVTVKEQSPDLREKFSNNGLQVLSEMDEGYILEGDTNGKNRLLVAFPEVVSWIPAETCAHTIFRGDYYWIPQTVRPRVCLFTLDLAHTEYAKSQNILLL